MDIEIVEGYEDFEAAVEQICIPDSQQADQLVV